MTAATEPRDYVVDCKLTLRTKVIVRDAAGLLEAIAKFEAGDWDADAAWESADAVDWQRIGMPELNK